MTESTLLNSLMSDSQHKIFYRQHHDITYAQNIKVLLSRKYEALSVFGIPLALEPNIIPYITTKLESDSFSYLYEGNEYGSIALRPSGFIVRTETEQRPYTILGALGLFGGAWNLAIVVYVFLFGTRSLHPWGFVQTYCCCLAKQTLSKFRETFPIMPLNSDPEALSSKLSFPDSETLSVNLTSQVMTLQKRLNTMESFLREYVVDISDVQDDYSHKSPDVHLHNSVASLQLNQQDTTESQSSTVSSA
ncbi:2153_t:CDS:2 [Paraglomus occultum]|uniref:2153_t:CDS:1 n=1 Tax=Paraglomus occultum TaxID=144539 RepID=A0A9N9FT68_9GLOM|nr:2153_t:CDS:2 [Paraglomus occultum]